VKLFLINIVCIFFKCVSDVGFLIILLSTIPMIAMDSVIKYILAAIIFGIGVYFERQYKCPSCHYVFDTRLISNKLIYCPKCGKRLQ